MKTANVHPVTIKLIGTKNFEVELYEMPSGLYCIRYENRRLGGSDYSENIQDFKTASYLFDVKVAELEGQ